jgi:hypothetical protein
VGLGTVLIQIDSNGKEFVIAYALRSNNRTERNYSSYYGECLAAVWAVSYFWIYLYGRPFVLKTDHEPLKWLMTSEKVTGMHARWASILQEYDVDIQHRSDVTHGDADGLWQNSLPSEEDDWLVDLPVIPPGTEGWTAEARRMHKNCVEYRLSILCYVAAMAESIPARTCLLDEQSTTEHCLLVEFYWMLHKIPEYLVQTNCMDCYEGLDHIWERQAGLQELWDIIARNNPASVQTLQRRMMLQLGALERGGCIRLD